MEEVNLVSSYYKQNGDNSAVTGGIGSEHLTDIANTIDVKLVKYGETGIKHTFDIEAGIDHYTSASSDMIDLSANSSASSSDNRFYPSLTYLRENEEKGRTIGIGVSSSTEFDYQSFGGNISFSQKTKDKNGEFTAKFQTFIDQLKLIEPVELRTSRKRRLWQCQSKYFCRNSELFSGSKQKSAGNACRRCYQPKWLFKPSFSQGLFCRRICSSGKNARYQT